MNILNKLEKPDLIVVEEWKERSEHFGQIQYNTFGHIELKNNDVKEFIMEGIPPYDLSRILEAFIDASMSITDDSFMFSANVIPELMYMRYDDSGELLITYRWKEV